ncbi:MAG: ATP-binding protein [Nitrospiraceae bacterium]|nr:ATP-binding protein [Nitrospiraceae bacterium]
MTIAVIVLVSLVLAVLAVRGIMLYRRFLELNEFVEGLAKGGEGLSRRYYLRGKRGFSKVLYNLSVLAANMQEQNRENEAFKNRLSVLLKNIPDGIALIDARGRIRSLNPALENLLYLRGHAVSGKGLAESVGVAGLGELLNRARDGSPENKETLAFNSKFLEVTATPFLDVEKGQYAGQVVVFRDVTADKRIDEIRKDFVANVSHELKTPVTAIKGYVDTLLDGAMENREDLSRFLNGINFQVGRMEQIIKDLIELSKIEFGAMTVEKKTVPLSEMVGRVLSLYEEKAIAKGIYVRADISEDCPSVQADPGMFSHILSNLLDNAVKYTDSGGVVIRAREGENYACVLVVQDTGIGVPKKFVPRLGERFFRVDPSRSRELGGTGLGLAIVKHLVLAMGWKMHIDSDPGKGTSIRIYIN